MNYNKIIKIHSELLKTTTIPKVLNFVLKSYDMTNTHHQREHGMIGEVCGRFRNPETNDRGLKLLDFATYKNLVLANTLGNHKPSRRWTWHSPDGTYHSQIDYILVKKRFRQGIKTARTRTFQVQMLQATMTGDDNFPDTP